MDVTFRPRRIFALYLSVLCFLTAFLVATVLPDASDRTVGDHALFALACTAGMFGVVIIPWYLRPWVLRVTAEGLDARPTPLGGETLIPWSAIVSAGTRHGDLRVVVNPDRMAPRMNHWDRMLGGRRQVDGGVVVTVRLGAIRPDRFALAVALAEHLPPGTLTVVPTDKRPSNQTVGNQTAGTKQDITKPDSGK